MTAPGRRAVALATSVLIALSACTLEPIDLEAVKPLALRSTVTAADGTVLARLFRENRALVPLSRIPAFLIDAVLSAEDARFLDHEGFDLRSIARAAIRNLQHGEVVQGGSTITQQYVKNTYFRSPRRTFERKARELRLAMEVERRFTKAEILERYLNTVYFGDGAYGIKAAAETFFGHGVGRLSLAESALLASLIKAPAGYNPRDHVRRAKKRRDYVLARMAELGYISAAEAASATVAPIRVISRPRRISVIEPYFLEAVRQEIVGDRRLGASRRRREEALYGGGLHVTTTLVPELQRAASDAVASILDRPGDPSAAVVAIKPKTGEIVAMVGGRDWNASQVNLALGAKGGGSGRQAGSSFKPIVVAAALESGIPLSTRYDSGPWAFSFPDGSSWSGSNAEGGGYGPLSIHEALVRSVNGVFARLSVDVGAGQIAGQAQLMGVRSRLPAVPSIALGSAEVSVVDMAAAFATLANGGTAIEPTTINRIRTAEGSVLPPEQETVGAAMAPGSAFLLTRALKQVIARGTGRAAAIGRPAAGKTGTTNDFADAWFVGYTPQLVAAVWVGHPEGRVPMTAVHGRRVYGGTLPAQIWQRFMLDAHAGKPVRPFALPRSELVTVRIDPLTGLLAADWCPGRKRTMLRQLVPTRYCPLPPIDDPAPGGAPVTPAPSATPSMEPSPRMGAVKTDKSVDASPSPRPTTTKSGAAPKG